MDIFRITITESRVEPSDYNPLGRLWIWKAYTYRLGVRGVFTGKGYTPEDAMKAALAFMASKN
jgi:hypothetical protein